MPSIGVDAGTSAVKAVLFDDDLLPLAQAQVVVPVRHPLPGHCEQDMTAVAAAVADVVRRVAPADGRVDAVAVTAQGDGCWLVDDHGAPTGPALLWNDARADAVAAGWERDGRMRRAFEITGSYGNAGLAHAQLSWLRGHDPDRLAASTRLLSCGSWLFHGLTGRSVLDVSEACNPFLDARSDEYSEELLQLLDLGWARELLPPVVRGAERVATLTGDAAARTGLQPGTPVVLAPYDVVATGVGVGAVAPGTGFAVLGTTLCVGIPVVGSGLPRAPAGMSLATGEPDLRLLAYATLAGTEVLDWWARVMGLASAADVTALAGTARPADADAADGAEAAPMLLPYLSPAGERAPFRDPAARGAVLGLTLRHDRADLARAVVVGLSLAVRDCLRATGHTPELLNVCGGGSRSDVWCRLLADVVQIPVVRPATDQVGARGAVLVARAALDPGTGLARQVAASVQPGTTFLPDPGAAARHDADFARFVAARESGATHA